MKFVLTLLASSLLAAAAAAQVTCVTNADCLDTNPCTVDTCVVGICPHAAGNAGATCRPVAGPCDVAEACDGTSTACPPDSVSGALVVCRASTGPCDAAEHCTGSGVSCPADVGGSVPMDRPKVIIARLAAPPGDERLRFKGEVLLPFPFSPPLDPPANGVQIIIVGNNGGTIVDADIPPGVYNSVTRQGWSATGGKYLYKDLGISGQIQGIKKVVIKDRSAHSPGLVRFVVAGKNGSYPVVTASLPIKASLGLSPSGSQCAEATFPGPPPLPLCNLEPAGSSLVCK